MSMAILVVQSLTNSFGERSWDLRYLLRLRQPYIIRVPIAYGLAYLTRSQELPQGRQESVYILLLISWIIGAVMTGVAYKRGKWKGKALA